MAKFFLFLAALAATPYITPLPNAADDAASAAYMQRAQQREIAVLNHAQLKEDRVDAALYRFGYAPCRCTDYQYGGPFANGTVSHLLGIY